MNPHAKIPSNNEVDASLSALTPFPDLYRFIKSLNPNRWKKLNLCALCNRVLPERDTTAPGAVAGEISLLSMLMADVRNAERQSKMKMRNVSFM